MRTIFKGVGKPQKTAQGWEQWAMEPTSRPGPQGPGPGKARTWRPGSRVEKAEDSQAAVTPTSLSSLRPSRLCRVPTTKPKGSQTQKTPRKHLVPAVSAQRSRTAQGRDCLTRVFMRLLLAPNSLDAFDTVVYDFEIYGGEDTIIFFLL